MDNKKIIIGGLAIVGALALFMYVKPKSKAKKNSDGFFNAQGRGMYSQCVTSDGRYYSTRGMGICNRGDRGTVRYA
jgi:hypothetical protein